MLKKQSSIVNGLMGLLFDIFLLISPRKLFNFISNKKKSVIFFNPPTRGKSGHVIGGLDRR